MLKWMTLCTPLHTSCWLPALLPHTRTLSLSSHGLNPHHWGPSSKLSFLQPQPAFLGPWKNALPSVIGPGCDQAADRNNILPSALQYVGRFNPFYVIKLFPPPLSSASGSPPRGQLVHLWSTSLTTYLLCKWIFLLCFIFMRSTRQVQAAHASDQTPITFEVGRT